MLANRSSEKGGALIMCMIMAVLVGGMLIGLVGLSLNVSRAAGEANDRLVRLYAAESGLERIRQLVCENTTASTDWLDSNDSGNPIVFSEGDDKFSVGDCTVQVKVQDISGSWFLVTSTATDADGRTTSIAMTSKPRTYFSDYARFVSKSDLSIGSNASYNGKVHSNGKISCNGSNITFYDEVSAVGGIYSNSSTTFLKKATPNTGKAITLPEATELEDLCKNPPVGAKAYDWDNVDFKTQFEAATGKTPNSTLDVSVTFDRDIMTVTSTCKVGWSYYTMTETNITVPDQEAMYIRGTTSVTGNISRRTSIITPKAITVNNSIRYVDDSGDRLWQLQDSSGNAKDFNSSMNTWSESNAWRYYDYEMASDWSTRAPVDGEGNKITPCLGLVSGSTIYLKGTNSNREIHAAFFSSESIIQGTGSKRNNLLIHGSIITTGTNSLSGYYSNRIYSYDPNLKKNPPPAFPTTISPTFRNWHIVE